MKNILEPFKSFAARLAELMRGILASLASLYKKLRRALIIATAAFVLVAAVIASQHLYGQSAKREFTSRFMKAIEIDELSTARLIYNGIVEMHRGDGEKIEYRIKYNSTIKVGIQFEDMRIEADRGQKTVKITLPPISVQTPVIDPASLSFIPPNPNIDLKEAISACREDARREAEQSKELIEAAEENLKSVIEALTLPILRDEGYKIAW